MNDQKVIEELLEQIEQLLQEVKEHKALVQYTKNQCRLEIKNYQKFIKGQLRQAVELELLGLESVADILNDKYGERIQRRVDRIRSLLRNRLE